VAGQGGAVVSVSRGVHYVMNPDGIDFMGKSITLTSMDPDDPDVVASTIIECLGWQYSPQRAFHFHSGEDANTVVEGFTIRGGFIVGAVGGIDFTTGGPVNPADDQSPIRAASGEDAVGTGYGGGILCENSSSPMIRNCIIEDCNVMGAIGGMGMSGPPMPDEDGVWGGHGGSGTGSGYGGGIACLGASNPIIEDCIIRNNAARGGSGGIGGNGSIIAGDRASHGGNGGNAIGNGYGGGIYCENGSIPIIRDCTFVGNLATSGIPGAGGTFGAGEPLEGDDPPYPRASDGSDGFTITVGNLGGGAIACRNTDVNPVDCTFFGNQAYELHSILMYSYSVPCEGIHLIHERSLVYTLGGALYSDVMSTVTLENCDFTNHLGGVVYCEPNCVLIAEDCSFMDNSGTTNGGAIYMGESGILDVNECRFVRNSVSGDGGAVSTDTNADIRNCLFEENSAGGNGGAVEAFYDIGAGDPNIITRLVVTFESCIFNRNEAIAGGTGRGGGVYFKDVNGTFVDCDLVDNAARAGGGLCAVLGTVNYKGGSLRRQPECKQERRRQCFRASWREPWRGYGLHRYVGDS